LALGPGSRVVELASNDGYLLQHFLGTGIDVLGIDPAANVAEAAEERGVATLVEFFGRATAERLVSEGNSADLVIGNNVLAQVPDLNDFVAGVAVLLRPKGTATFEVPELRHLLENVEYDTIYHEHYSYFAVATLVRIFEAHGLVVYDVEDIPTHGGSVRVYVQHARGPHEVKRSVADAVARERAAGLRSPARYERFAAEVVESKLALLELLIALRRGGRTVAAFGAPGKGNTLLNYCGIRTDLVEYTVDSNPYKQGMFTPGTRLPIFPVERIAETQPDYVLVLPWNLLDEIASQLRGITKWGGKLVVPIPIASVVELGEAARDRSIVPPHAA
jgi:SAM-dependent methyltransferase